MKLFENLFPGDQAGTPSGFVETPKALMGEVAEGLIPMVLRRNEAIDISVFDRITSCASLQLGAEAVKAIRETIVQAEAGLPPMPQREHISYAPGVAEKAGIPTRTAPQVEIGAGLLNLEDKHEARLAKETQWDGDMAPVTPDPVALSTTVETAEDFFRQDFQLVSPQPVTAAYAPVPARTEQDMLVEAGIGMPEAIDQTRVQWDDLTAMADAPEITGSLDNLPADQIAARVNASMSAEDRAADARRILAEA